MVARVLVYYLLSSLSPIYMPDLPQIGATIPSLIVSSIVYMAICILSLGLE